MICTTYGIERMLFNAGGNASIFESHFAHGMCSNSTSLQRCRYRAKTHTLDIEMVFWDRTRHICHDHRYGGGLRCYIPCFQPSEECVFQCHGRANACWLQYAKVLVKWCDADRQMKSRYPHRRHYPHRRLRSECTNPRLNAFWIGVVSVSCSPVNDNCKRCTHCRWSNCWNDRRFEVAISTHAFESHSTSSFGPSCQCQASLCCTQGLLLVEDKELSRGRRLR